MQLLLLSIQEKEYIQDAFNRPLVLAKKKTQNIPL